MRRFEIECLPLFTEGGKGGFEVLVHETLAWDQIRDAHDRMAVRQRASRLFQAATRWLQS